jgi:formylglycine-generating enzyme required for sulfatase activity
MTSGACIEGFLDLYWFRKKESRALRKTISGLRYRLLLVLILSPFHIPAVLAAEFNIDGLISGSWYDPAQSGHGYVLEVLETDTVPILLGYWFVWLDGQPVWVVGIGPIDGDHANLELSYITGAEFPPEFDSADIRVGPWGSALVRFNSVNEGVISWSTILPEFNDGEIQITRLSNIAGDHTPGQCLSGAWYDPSQDGHGFIFEIIESNDGPRVVGYWFVNHQTEPFWLIGSGFLTNGRADLDMIQLSGGEFPPQFDPASVEMSPWGRVSVRFDSHDTGSLSYLPEAVGFESGVLQLTRLTNLAGHECIGIHTFKDCPECPLMASLPAGSFSMGSDSGAANEQPVHGVNVQPFAIGVYEVTLQELQSCFEADACIIRGRQSLKPATRVSWNDANDYLRWLSERSGQNYRLPTEAEWEYAARAGTSTAYPWGNSIGQNNANCSDCGDAFLIEVLVGSFAANAFGLFDMNGNLYEWVQECKMVNYIGAPGDGSVAGGGDCSFHHLRGGSWADQPYKLRSAFRGYGDTGGRFTDSGFRVVRELRAQP